MRVVVLCWLPAGCVDWGYARDWGLVPPSSSGGCVGGGSFGWGLEEAESFFDVGGKEVFLGSASAGEAGG